MRVSGPAEAVVKVLAFLPPRLITDIVVLSGPNYFTFAPNSRRQAPWTPERRAAHSEMMRRFHARRKAASR